jgi:hypothetical protein
VLTFAPAPSRQVETDCCQILLSSCRSDEYSAAVRLQSLPVGYTDRKYASTPSSAHLGYDGDRQTSPRDHNISPGSWVVPGDCVEKLIVSEARVCTGVIEVPVESWTLPARCWRIAGHLEAPTKEDYLNV